MILFAHRGASARAPENTLAAFRLALALGATGLESDVHLDADGVPVLVHDARIRTPAGWLAIREARARDLAGHGVPTLDDLYRACGARWPLSLDLNDGRPLDAARAVIAVARRHGQAAVANLLLCHDDVSVLAAIASGGSGAVPVLSTDRAAIGSAPDGLALALDRMRRAGIGVLNLHRLDWLALSGAEAIARVHDAGLQAFAWDTQRASEVRAMLTAGADAVYADDPAALLEGSRRA